MMERPEVPRDMLGFPSSALALLIEARRRRSMTMVA